jgi:HEAT repeat protein
LVNVGEQAVEELIKIYNDERFSVDTRRVIPKVLGRIGSERAVPSLIRMLEDDYHYTRKDAADALANIGDSRAVEPIVQTLQKEDVYKRDIAVALAQFGDPRALETLLNTNPHLYEEKIRFAQGLAKIGDRRGITKLNNMLKDIERSPSDFPSRDEAARKAIREAIEKIEKKNK